MLNKKTPFALEVHRVFYRTYINEKVILFRIGNSVRLRN